MDIPVLLSIGTLAVSTISGVVVLHVQKSVAELEVKILRDAQERELRQTNAIRALGDRFQDKLDQKADLALTL